MNKALIFISCILLVFTSCKKTADVAPANTISATIDGVDESFNSSVSAQLASGIMLNSNLAVFGTNGSAKGSDVMSITIGLNQSIVTGSYTSATNAVAILYDKGPYSLANLNDYSTDPNGSPSTVVITSITNTSVQGTFSGKLIYGGATKTVTNGKFNVSLTN